MPASSQGCDHYVQQTEVGVGEGTNGITKSPGLLGTRGSINLHNCLCIGCGRGSTFQTVHTTLLWCPGVGWKTLTRCTMSPVNQLLKKKKYFKECFVIDFFQCFQSFITNAFILSGGTHTCGIAQRAFVAMSVFLVITAWRSLTPMKQRQSSHWGSCRMHGTNKIFNFVHNSDVWFNSRPKYLKGNTQCLTENQQTKTSTESFCTGLDTKVRWICLDPDKMSWCKSGIQFDTRLLCRFK